MKNFIKGNSLIILIIILGAFLRAYRLPEYLIFLGDEGRDALAVYNILHGQLTLLGPTSSVGGFFMGPIYYYMMAPFFFLFHYNPAGPGYMVVLFGLATIFLVYWVGKNFFNKMAGLIGAFLYSIAPIVIFYSRSSWNPNVLPFFSFTTLIVTYKALQKNSKFLFMTTGFLMGVCLQLHYLATFLGVIVFAYVLLNTWISRQDFPEFFKNFAYRNSLMLFGFLVGFSPFLLFEFRHGFQNTQNIIKFIFNSPDTGVGNQFGATLVFVITRLFGGLLFSYPLSTDLHFYPKQTISLWSGLSFVLAITSLILPLTLIRKKDKENFRKYSMLILWGFLGIILFGMYKKSIYDYYLAFLFPLPFLLVGAVTSVLLSSRKYPIYKIFGIVIISLSVVSAILFSPLRVNPNNQYKQVKTVSEFILSKTTNKPFNFALLSQGNSDYAYRFIFRYEGHQATVLETPLTDPDRLTVADQLLVLCDYRGCNPLGDPLWEVAGFGQSRIVGEWETSVGKLYKLVHDGSNESTKK